jgi:glycine/D-amino acid oxidase-like deaminating enzyme
MESESRMKNNNNRTEEYDLVILGGGTGSTIAAWTFAKEGQRVAVIERKYIGGSCRTSRVFPARTSFIARRSRPIFAGAKSSASPERLQG